jgi:hypothetical protein
MAEEVGVGVGPVGVVVTVARASSVAIGIAEERERSWKARPSSIMDDTRHKLAAARCLEGAGGVYSYGSRGVNSGASHRAYMGYFGDGKV